MHERFRGQEVRVVGVHYDDSGDPAAYMAERGYTYGLIPDGRAVVAAMKVKKIPQITVLDRSGSVLYAKIGFSAGDEEEIAAVVEARLR